MDLDDFLKNPEDQKHEFSLAQGIIRIIELSCYNRAVLDSILINQLETQELIKGNTEINDNVSERLKEIQTSISQISLETYHGVLNTILK